MERLDKTIASQGKYSRSDVKKLIKEGRVTLDGEAVRSAVTKVNPDLNVICVDGERVCY